MQILKKPITRKQLREIANRSFGDFVKVVVDVSRECMAIDAQLHADEESLLLENGSQQKDLWGINLYPEITNDDWVEFDSMINVRPAAGNTSRGVEDVTTQKRIREIVAKFII